MKKFPIKIDLSTFFEDERKFVIILVDPQWENVKCLQHRVEEIFDVKPVRFLTSDNLFIPQQESIEVLEFTESIKAFIPKHVIEESRRRSKQYQQEKYKIPKFDVNTELLPIEETQTKKRKYYSLGTDIWESTTPNRTKKSKRTPVLTQPISNESQEITSTNEQAIFVEDISLAITSNENQTITDKTENESESIRVKPRRKSKRRIHKENSERNLNNDPEENTQVGSIIMRSEIASSTFINKSKSLENNSHIYFEDSTIVESTTLKQPTKHNTKPTLEKTISSNVVFKCKLSEIEFGEPLIHPLQTINKKHQTRKPVINIQENIIIRPADMDILTKHTPTEISLNNLEGNISSGKLNASENLENKESTVELKEMKNAENGVDNSSNGGEVIVGIENVQSHLNIAGRLQHGESEIGNENVSQIENSKEENNLDGTVNDKHENHDLKIKDSNDSNANQSKVQHSTDECILNEIEEETANPRAENIKQKISIRKSNNSIDISDISMALDGSSVIDLDDDEDVIDLSDADDQQQLRGNPSSILLDSLNKSINSMRIKEMLPFCTKLVGLPDLEDVIIFKFNRREFGDKTDVSQFIACRCEHINKRTKVLKLAIIDASLENDILPQKYSYNLDESFENRFMNIKLTEMIEPLVLKT